MLYGITPPGGLVNVVSKRPSNDAATLFGFSFGTNDSRELSVESTRDLVLPQRLHALVLVRRRAHGRSDGSGAVLSMAAWYVQSSARLASVNRPKKNR